MSNKNSVIVCVLDDYFTVTKRKRIRFKSAYSAVDLNLALSSLGLWHAIWYDEESERILGFSIASSKYLLDGVVNLKSYTYGMYNQIHVKMKELKKRYYDLERIKFKKWKEL